MVTGSEVTVMSRAPRALGSSEVRQVTDSAPRGQRAEQRVLRRTHTVRSGCKSRRHTHVDGGVTAHVTPRQLQAQGLSQRRSPCRHRSHIGLGCGTQPPG